MKHRIAALAAVGVVTLGTVTGASAAAAAAPAAPPPATTASLRVWLGLGAGESTAGSTYYPLEFTNISGHTVTVRGFPGVSAIGQTGQLGSPAGWERTTPNVTVTLTPGATAHTLLQDAAERERKGSQRSPCLVSPHDGRRHERAHRGEQPLRSA